MHPDVKDADIVSTHVQGLPSRCQSILTIMAIVRFGWMKVNVLHVGYVIGYARIMFLKLDNWRNLWEKFC